MGENYTLKDGFYQEVQTGGILQAIKLHFYFQPVASPLFFFIQLTLIPRISVEITFFYIFDQVKIEIFHHAK
jgi:hypothetical protein